MKAVNSSTFCSVPWTQLATNSSGFYRVCCNALPVKNLVKNTKGEVLKISKNSAQEVWDSPTYKTIREQMLHSERPEMCTRCFREEDSGVESARQRWNKRWNVTEDEIEGGTANARYLDLRLGNLCNLKCRMCNPYSSSKWVDEWNSVAESAELVPHQKIDATEAQRLSQMDWPESAETWKNLSPILNTVEEIYLTGGEPFLSLKQADLLQWLIDIGRASQVIIKYNTNLTVVPEKLIPLWKKFKSVRLNLSVDGIGRLNDYIRYPSRWTVVEQNLRLLCRLKEEGLPFEISVHTTVQGYNILRLHETIDFFQKNFQITPYLNILNHPACLNIRTLPKSLKKQALQSLTSVQSEKGVNEVISYMMAEDWAQKYFEQFKRYTNQLDQNRQQSLSHLQPEFSVPWKDHEL